VGVEKELIYQTTTVIVLFSLLYKSKEFVSKGLSLWLQAFFKFSRFGSSIASLGFPAITFFDENHSMILSNFSEGLYFLEGIAVGLRS